MNVARCFVFNVSIRAPGHSGKPGPGAVEARGGRRFPYGALPVDRARPLRARRGCARPCSGFPARAVLLLAGLLLAGAAFAQQYAFPWNPRTGDAWIDRQLADINDYGSRYHGAFIDELVRYRAAPREFVTELVTRRNWAPGDVYYACALAQTIGRPCRAVAEAWARGHDQGWEAVARDLDVADYPDANARLKRDIRASYERWARPLAEVGDDAGDAKARDGG